MSFPSLFAIVVGVGMIGQWSYAYIKRQNPELETEPIRIKFHIAGEFITALALIMGGFGLLVDQSWSPTIFVVATGMLFYTVIISPGYFAQKGKWEMVGLFAVIQILAIVSLFMIYQQGLQIR